MRRWWTLRRRWKTLLLSLVILFAVVVGTYAWYVRGVGIRPVLISQREFTWDIRAPMPQPRTEVAAAALGGRIYVMGGFDGFARTTGTVQIYDPEMDIWTAGPALPQAVHHGMAATLGERLYLIGGLIGPRLVPTDRAFVFDGTAWRPIASLPEPVGAGGIAVLEGRIHVVGGKGSRADVAAHYAYNPESESLGAARAPPRGARSSGRGGARRAALRHRRPAGGVDLSEPESRGRL